MIKFTKEALETLTLPQRDSIVTMCTNYRTSAINVSKAEVVGTLYFVLDQGNSAEVYGVIFPDGTLST